MLNNLSQQTYPRLWLLFQHFFGATKDKRRMALGHLGEHRKVLEIGCSLGVVSSAFTPLRNVSYLGIDIDEQAINFAKKKFSTYPHMEFAHLSLNELAASGRKFDYILFANILHHVEDAVAVELLKDALSVLDKNGTLIVTDPDILWEDASLLVKALYRLERGLYRRPLQQVLNLLKIAEISVKSASAETYSVGLFPGIVCGHMQFIVCGHVQDSNHTN